MGGAPQSCHPTAHPTASRGSGPTLRLHSLRSGQTLREQPPARDGWEWGEQHCSPSSSSKGGPGFPEGSLLPPALPPSFFSVSWVEEPWSLQGSGRSVPGRESTSCEAKPPASSTRLPLLAAGTGTSGAPCLCVACRPAHTIPLQPAERPGLAAVASGPAAGSRLAPRRPGPALGRRPRALPAPQTSLATF